jgi:peptidoglycan/xylan/chitin deacetylase (PgdA/CDA1 family)
VPAARILLWVSTIGAIALAVRAIAFAPLPPALAVLLLCAYLALVLCGVFFMRLQMFADVFWRGAEGARGVALTFDDGPSPEHTPRVLELLAAAGARATFFVIGRKADAHPELVRAIADAGHAIGVHGYQHDRLFSMRRPAYVRTDLARAVRTIEEITGQRPVLFRPPIGHTNAIIAKEAAALELELVGWSVRALDGTAGARAERVAERVVAGLRDGAVVLLHDAAERDDRTPASVEALPRILDAMRERGLAAVRVDAWMDEEARRAADAGSGGAARRRKARLRDGGARTRAGTESNEKEGAARAGASTSHPRPASTR